MNWNGNYFWSQPPFPPEKIKATYKSLPKLDHEIGETARNLAKWTKEMDTTRPVIANCILPSVSFVSGFTDALDIVGFSYRRVMYDYAKKYYPQKVIMGTENVGQWHEWKAVEERDFVAGLFLWTGIDYMGESNNSWPQKDTPSGLIDQAGFEKPSYHMFQCLWKEEPHIYICTNNLKGSAYKTTGSGDVVEKNSGSWEHQLWYWYPVNEYWNYNSDDTTIVEVISNCDSVNLFLNGKSLGKKYLQDFPDRIYKWAVPFEAGELTARGNKGDNSIETSLTTSGRPTQISLELDRNELKSNSLEVVHVIVQLKDENGIPVRNVEKKISFHVDGPLTLLGVDNGWAKNTQPYKNNEIITHNGKALSILQVTKVTGEAKITVSGD